MSQTTEGISAQISELVCTIESLRLELAASRLAIDALENSVQRMRSLATISTDWLWEQDDQYRFVTFNSAVVADTIKGIVFDDGIGKCRWDLPNATPLGVSWEMHKKMLDARLPFHEFEFFRTLANGTLRYLSVSGVPVFDTHKRFIGYQGTARDTTKRQTADARLRTVVDALVEGVVLREADGRIVDCNASAERILGKTLAQLKGQTNIAQEWQTLREDGSPLPEEERPFVIAKRTGLPQSNRVICYRKPDGSELWALVNVQPLFDGPAKKPSGFVTSLTDINKHKHAELEIVRLNVALENRVLRRTSQLESANKELEAFSYSVAHDLRSPLSTINGFSVLLQKAVPPDSGERARHYLDRIRIGVQRMGELTDGLLSLAQLSRTSLRWDVVDMSAEAGTILRLLSESETTRKAVITIDPHLLVRADRSLIRQVLQNLIANAWKFSSKKSRTEIEVGKQTDIAQESVYFVKDNGAGFDMAYADKLFGTFQRLHSPEEFSGSGIGLATVNRIITRHGGKIWARSAVGEGSTFYFTIGREQLSSVTDTAVVQPATHPGVNARWPLDAEPTAIPGATSRGTDFFSVSDQLFSNAFENAAIGMVLVALDFRRLKVNSAFCQMLGYSEAEMLSRDLMDITHADDVEWDLLQRRRALAGEIETYQGEKRYIHKSGRIVWGYLTCSLVRDADRSPIHFISQIQDITERRKGEQILRESEERFRALTELSADWFWEQDENYRFVMLSGIAKGDALSGIAIGKTRWELGHTVDESVWAAHRLLLDRREIFRDFEITRLDENGHVQYLCISGEPIFDTSGRFTGYRGVGQNHTEMRRVSEALRVSELQLRQITDTLPALIAYVDSGQRFRFHNRAYEEVYALTYEQINDKHMREVMGDEPYQMVKSRVEEVLSGYPVAYECTQKTARGTYRDYVVNYFPRYGEGDEDGKVIGFYSQATDITELKRVSRMQNEFILAFGDQLGTPLANTLDLLERMRSEISEMQVRSPNEVNRLLNTAKDQVTGAIQMLHLKVASTSSAVSSGSKA